MKKEVITAPVIEVRSNKQPRVELPDEPVISSNTSGATLEYQKTIELTMAEAQRILELPEFAGDRVLNNNHFIELAREMEAGNFQWEQVQIITCRFQGNEYRMNGQHTCWARLELEDKIKRSPVRFMRYKAETDHDMRMLYASIDRNKPRTNGNVIVAILGGRQEFNQFNKKQLKRLAEGLGFWIYDTDTQRSLHHGNDKANMMLHEHYNVATKVGNFCNMKTGSKCGKWLYRAAVTAAMYATFDLAPESAMVFWTSVREGTNLGPGDPRLLLRNFLMTAVISHMGKLTSVTKIVSSEEMYRTCVVAWNFFRSKSTCKTLKANMDKERPAPR